MLHVDAPANLGILQAALRKIATFELIDGDWINDLYWQYEEEEDILFQLLQAGYDSNQFWASFGFPLYLFAYSVALLIILPPINFVKSKIAALKVILSLRGSVGLLEGGENDEQDATVR